jgi:uncharacterized Zn finger protein
VSAAEQRVCPECSSGRTRQIQRGLAGPTDEPDQYYRCAECGRVTNEIVSRTAREVRIECISPGMQLREAGNLYRVRRVLKVGLNEYLVYLLPARDEPSSGA